MELRAIGAGSGTLWEQRHLCRALDQDRPDVLFAPGYTAPLFTSVPVVLTIHDVSFAAHPEWFSWREGVRRRLLTRQAARRARTVLTDTEFSRREIVEHLGLPSERVSVIRLGVDAPDVGSGTEGDASEPLVLFVGSIFNRRHIPELIEAFRTVVRSVPAARLTIVGENRTHPHVDLDTLVDRSGLGHRIARHHFVSDEELAALYRRARVFVFLSEYEGFGLTPLEALAAGVPIVVLDTPVAREVYGRAARYVTLEHVQGISDAIVRLLAENRDRRDVIDAAAQVLVGYSWQRAAAETLQAIAGAR